MLSLPGGHVGHYAKGTKLNGCIPRILASPCIEDDGFIDMLWQNSLGHMAFNDGVWSFDERRLLSFEQARQKQIYFTQHTGRPCPSDVGDAADGAADGACNGERDACGNGTRPADETCHRAIPPRRAATLFLSKLPVARTCGPHSGQALVCRPGRTQLWQGRPSQMEDPPQLWHLCTWSAKYAPLFSLSRTTNGSRGMEFRVYFRPSIRTRLRVKHDW
jgi:hypothetical protein